MSEQRTLVERLAEVVRHAPDCSGYGLGDAYCDCDAVNCLRDATPALALTAACLRARAALNEEKK